MRWLIGLPRDSGGDAEPTAAPTLASGDALLAQARTNGASSGREFTLTDTRGESLPLPAPVELAAYRIIQESLTNALKHASPGEVAVALGQGEQVLIVRITSPFGDRPGPRAPGSGAGLFDLDEYVFGALRAGAAGFLLKNTEAGDLIEAVRTVARGEGMIAPAVTRRLIAEFATPKPVRSANAPDPAILDVLTRREREVLSCLGEGMSNAEIAGRLAMAEATVKTHVSRLLGKLELRSRVQAAVLAQELNL